MPLDGLKLEYRRDDDYSGLKEYRAFVGHRRDFPRIYSGVFTPSPAHIALRIRALNWMVNHGFSTKFITSVMQFGSPSIARVYRAFYNNCWGAAEIEQRFAAFIETDKEPPNDS